MSVKIRVSYTEDEELQDILQRLSPDVKRCKVAKKGQYKLAYIAMKTGDSPRVLATKNAENP